MRLIDFLTEYGEAVEDEKEKAKKKQSNKPIKKFRPKHH